MLEIFAARKRCVLRTIFIVFKFGKTCRGLTFAFTVTGAATGITLDIVLVGTDSIIIRDLPADTYTVTPLNGWAWRMNGTAENNGTVVLSEDRTVTYNWTKVAELIYWLNGYAYRRECKG